MRALFAAIICALLLSACVPLAIVANGWGPEYRGYKSDLGTYVASKSVNTLCMSPKLRLLIWDFEGFFGKKIVVSSGYRTPWRNASVGGATKSYHTKCMAADFHIPGVSKSKLIAYAMRNRLVGGLGCYPGRKFIHVDVRSRPRGYRKPVTFSGC